LHLGFSRGDCLFIFAFGWVGLAATRFLSVTVEILTPWGGAGVLMSAHFFDLVVDNQTLISNALHSLFRTECWQIAVRWERLCTRAPEFGRVGELTIRGAAC